MLENHKNEVKASSKPDCPFCNETLKSEIDFIDYLVKNHPDKEAPYDILKSFKLGYKCLGCGDQNQSPFSYYRHLKYNHKKIRRRDPGVISKRADTNVFSKCQFCNKKFKHLSSLKTHILQKHSKT
jgi:hypothetical protein